MKYVYRAFRTRNAIANLYFKPFYAYFVRVKQFFYFYNAEYIKVILKVSYFTQYCVLNRQNLTEQQAAANALHIAGLSIRQIGNKLRLKRSTVRC